MTLTLVVTEIDWRRGRAYFEVRDHYGRVVRCGYQVIHVVFKHERTKHDLHKLIVLSRKAHSHLPMKHRRVASQSDT